MMFEPLKQNCIQMVTKELEAYYRVSAREMTRRLLQDTPLSVSIQNVLTALYKVTNLYELIDVIHNEMGVELTPLHETLMAAMKMESDLPAAMVERLWDTWPSKVEIEQPALGTACEGENPFGSHQYDSPIFWMGSPAGRSHTTSERSSFPEYDDDPILRPHAPTPDEQAGYELDVLASSSERDANTQEILRDAKRSRCTSTFFIPDVPDFKDENVGINYIEMMREDKTLEEEYAEHSEPQFMVEV